MSALANPSSFRRLFNSEFILLSLVLFMMTAGFISIAISQLCLGTSLILLLYRRGFKKIILPRTGLEISATVLAAWALINIAFSSDAHTSMVFYRRFFLFSAIWVVASVITTERRRFLMLIFSLVGALAISLYGEVMLVLETGSLFGHRFDIMSNSMTSGSLLMMALLLGFGFLLAGGQSTRVKVFIGLALTPILLGTVLTLTRSALLGVIAGLGVMILLSHRRWFYVLLGILVIGAIFFATVGESVLPTNVYHRLSLDYLLTGTNTIVRLEMWQGGWEMIKERPFTGVGDRNLTSIGSEFYGDADTVYHGHLHSNYVQLAVIWGIPGLLLALYFIVQPIFLLVRRWLQIRRLEFPPKVYCGWVLGACGVWTGFMLAGLTEWYFGDAETMLIYLAFFGCALGPWQNDQAEKVLNF